ncbi:MAG: YIP1 family protein [Deltaproteobacteria bacterium]|nr:YIP1 family protein [Deltaproteobacteria bacterium]
MNEHPVTEFETKNFFSSFFHTSKTILLSPKNFFQGMKREGGYLNPFLYMLCCVIFHVLIFGLLQKNPGFMLKSLLLGIAFPLITAGILFIIVTKIFKASGSYETAFRVNAYASAVNLVTWLPFVGLLLELYRIYLIVLGLSAAFSIKMTRALLAIVLTMAIYILAAGAIGHFTAGQ